MLYKFLIAMLVAVSLPLVSLLYTNGYKLEQNLELKVNENLSQTADLLALKIDDWNEMNLRLLKQNSSLSQIRSGVESQQKPILESMIDTYEWLYLAYAIGSDGYKTARSDDKPILNKDGTKAHFRGDRSYYKQIRSGSTIGQQLVLSRTLNKPAFILCRELSLKDSYGIKPGALCIGSTVDELSNSVVNTKIGKTGYAILLDDANKVIAHGYPDMLKEQLQDYSDQPVVTSARLEEPYVYQDGDIKKLAYMKSVGQGWRLVITQDYDDAYNEYFSSRRNALVLLLFTFIVSGVISYIMARMLAKPIQNLTVIANDIRKGSFYSNIDESKRTDEIGELARSIEKMSISISIAFKKLKSKK
jgi:methyl-accepting chemotaxis protein